ncbi:MAG: hypothetical protein H6730_33970 [Deltaproteobacteria bacterium]|nr:hypothetical protein [Deltaproteobacteria bacterium]
MRIYSRSIIHAALGAAVAASLAACGGDATNNNTNNNGTNNNNSTASLQQQAVDNGQIDYADGAGLTIKDTLAVDLSGTTIGAPATALPAGFEAANYHGAVDPAAATGWWEGWTYIDPAVDGSLPGAKFHPLEAEITGGTIMPAGANACTTVNPDFTDGGTVTIFGAVFPVCVISEDIEAATNLPNTHVYVLDGTINVGTGDAKLAGGSPSSSVTLTIDAGAQLYAIEGSASALVITRGSKIEAVGTADMPIIFAAVAANTTMANVITGDPTDLTGRGTWGGMVLSGMGGENSGDTNGELTTEAAPPDQERWFGGNNSADDSGTVKYVVIAESGYAFREGEEVQGLTLEAAGSGTEIDYLQITNSEDDCVEWFGGAAPIKHLICNGVDDDGLDMDEGFSGNVQFVIVRIGSNNGDHGIESDNNGGDYEAMPYSAPNLANITILGNKGKDDTNTNGALHREGFRGKMYRSVFTDDLLAGGAFEAGCLDVDNVLPAALQHFDAVYNCTPGPLTDDEE